MLLAFAVTSRKTVSLMCRKREVTTMRLIDADNVRDLFDGERKDGADAEG